MDRRLILADGSLWLDAPDYIDGSGCAKLGNRRHIGRWPPPPDLLRQYGCYDLMELYGYVN